MKPLHASVSTLSLVAVASGALGYRGARDGGQRE
jgi:hypothetical protein